MRRKIINRSVYLLVTAIFIVYTVGFAVPANATSRLTIDSDSDQKIPESYYPRNYPLSQEIAFFRAAGTIYENEPNNSYTYADRTYDDYDNFGKISSTSDVDWWVVRFSSSGYANFWLGEIPSGCDYELKLYASDGTTLLKSSLNSGNANELIGEYWVAANTDYYISIYSYSGSSTSEYYKFRTKNYPYHGYAGFTNNNSNKGVYATITTPSSLPNVSDSGESVWVSTSIDTNGEWIQTGARYYSSYTNFKTYTEHFSSGVYKLTTIGTHILGASISYKVEYNSSDSKWHAYIGGVDRVGSTLATVNNSVLGQAEVHKKLIEMGPFSFSSVLIKNSSGTWVNNTAAPTATTPYSWSGSATNFTVSGP